MDTPKRYHPALVTIHWLMAALVFVNLYLGIITFENRSPNQDFQTMNTLVTVHMAVGATILILLLIRFIVKLRTSKPAPATTGNKLLDMLAAVVHSALYLTILAVTVLGLVFSLQSGRFQSAFLGQRSQFGTPPGGTQMTPGVPPDGSGGQPGLGGNPQGRQGGGPGRPSGGPGGFGLLTFHEWAAYLLLGLVSLHISAALYHQFIRRDNLIARMWYGSRY